MDTIAKRLKAYIDAHPFDSGDSDATTVLDQLYQAYAFCMDLSDGYTVIPRSIMSKELKPSEFVTLLELYHSAGNSGRCFPSLCALAKRLDTVKAAVCRSIRGLRHALTLTRLHCKKANRAFASNSYYLLDHIFRGGGIIFEQHSSIITDNVGFADNKNNSFVLCRSTV